MNFISYLKTLSPEDWSKKATDKWTVKDVVAHMVGWEKAGYEVLDRYYKTGEDNPWFIESDEYDDFNNKSIEFYKDYSLEQLIVEWEEWQKKIEDLIEKIGEEKLRANKDMGWILENEEQGHYKHHIDQIKSALE